MNGMTLIVKTTARLVVGFIVVFAGYLQDQVSFLNDIDLLLLPSHTEGLPNVILEALAMSIPIVATRVGGVPDVIKDGVNGRLIEPSSPESIAEAMEQFLTEREVFKRLAEGGRKMVEDRFNFRRRTDSLMSI